MTEVQSQPKASHGLTSPLHTQDTAAPKSEEQPTLTSLAAKITTLTSELSTYLSTNKIPVPTFAADSPTSYVGLSHEMFMKRQILLDAVSDLSYLAQGPSESIFNYAHCVMPNATCLNVLNYFDFWSAVPLTGTATYASIASKTHLPEDVVYRILQHAMTLRIFSESNPGSPASLVRHTSRSAALLKSSGLKALVSTVLDDAGAPMMVLNTALEKHSLNKKELSSDMNDTSFALFHEGETFGKYQNSWEFIENDGEGKRKGWRQKNFVRFMDYIKEIFELEKTMMGVYDWEKAGKIRVVDLGGSGGHDSFVLAKAFPNLQITVQDLPQVRSVFEANIPSTLSSRVTFCEHDLFQPQFIIAQIYILKLILHDWPAAECLRIIRSLIPALQPGAKILFIDYIGKPGGGDAAELPRTFRQFGTATDLRMMALFNTKERPVSDYKSFFREASEGFEILRVEANPETFIAVIEVVWKGL